MEDMPVILNNFPYQNCHLFGILDGHGGKEVVKFV
jgi:hypothetical protein